MATLTRRAALALGTAALAAPRPGRAQAPVSITVHYAQPFIYKESYDAIAAAFARREPNIQVEFVTTPNYEEACSSSCASRRRGGCRTSPTRASTGCGSLPSAASPRT
jgi:ABC-type glycerol-3-phosphate transport system substrate-binding protein